MVLRRYDPGIKGSRLKVGLHGLVRPGRIDFLEKVKNIENESI